MFHSYYEQIQEISLKDFSSVKVPLVAPIPGGTAIAGLYLDADYVYYSDTATDRVIRIKLQK